MRTKDKVFGGISGFAVLFGIGALIAGAVPLGLPALIIGLLLGWTVYDNRNWK